MPIDGNEITLGQLEPQAPPPIHKLPEQMTNPRNSPPRPAQHARRFAHVRECQASALIEDYVEMIGDLIELNGEARVADIAARMGVAQPTATKAVARLKRQGLATSQPYRGIFLTEEGKQLADQMRSRHRIVVQLLVALGVPEEAAEIDGEGMEHHVSEHTLAAFVRFLGMPEQSGRQNEKWRPSAATDANSG